MEEIVDILSCVDDAKATTNLWGERWSKLTMNSSGNPVGAMTGLGGIGVAAMPDARRIQIEICKESCQVALAQNYQVEPIRGVSAVTYARADDGEVYEELDAKHQPSGEGPDWKSSMSQDVAKGRRTEIEFMNGYIVEQGRRVGIQTPVNAAIVQVVKQVESGQLQPGPDNVRRVLEHRRSVLTPVTQALDPLLLETLRELLHDLKDWTLDLADSEWALGALLLLTFSESTFFPIPPDPLLIAIGVANPSSAVWIAALVTLASVAGAFVGHYLGRRVGRPLLYRLVSEDKVTRAEALFNRYGTWAILVAAFTPIPYKVFTILAGIMDLPIRPFLLASLIGRGARFLTIGVLIYIFGEPIQDFIDEQFELLTIAAALGLVVVLVGYLVYLRVRRG